MSPDIQNVLDADDKLKELSRDNNGNPNLGYITTMDLLFPREEIKPEDVVLKKLFVGLVKLMKLRKNFLT